MREDDEIGHYVPLLRRIIILVAVIIAIPVVLWTITAFVRSYVGAPKIPTFHQLASTASINTPASDNPGQNAGQTNSQDATDRMMADAAKQAKLTDPSSSTVEAKATTPKGPFLGDRTPENAATMPAGTASSIPPPPSAPKLTDMSPTVPMQPKPADMPAPVAAATPDTTTSNVTLAGQMPASDPQPDAMAAAPLSDPIPLPRRRPHVAVDAQTAPAAPTAPMTQMASASSSGVPMPRPRPRPDAAGPGAPAEPASSGPLDFLQNLFGGK